METTEIATQVPVLRFPEFEGEWEVKKIIDFAPLQRGFDLPVDKIINGEYPVVFSNGILKHHNEYKALSPGVVTGRSGTIGNVTYVEKNYWPHNTALWVTDFNGNHPKYVYYFYLNFKLERFGTGSGVPTLNRNDVHIQKTFIPSLPEQQKIASFLKAIDNKIEQLTRKKALLEQYKKGVMQQIFSQQIRFKDDYGNDYPEWEEKELGKIGLKVIDGDRGNNYPNGSDFSSSGYCLFLSAKNVTKEGFCFEDNSFISKEKDAILRNGKLKRFDLVLTTRGTVGNVAYYNEKISYDNLRINSGMVIIRNESEQIIPLYLYIYFNSKFFRNQITSITFGSAQPQLTVKGINKFKIRFPSTAEQNKIANFLSTIDIKIQSVEKQITATKAYKKGLLQQMFV